MKAVLKAGAALAVCAGLFVAAPLVREYREELREQQNEKLEQDGTELAMHQKFMMTRDLALNEVPTGRLLQAQLQRQALIASGRTAALNWAERGPQEVGGRTRAVIIDSRDATGNTIFAGSVSGGIWKTTNFLSAAPTWTPVNDKMANLAVTCLWQSKTNANLMLAGTGEGYFNVDAIRGAGIFRSTDGGITWAQIPTTADFEYCQDIVMDNNNNIYVSLRNLSSANRGVMRSTDNGVSWTQVLGLPLTTLPFATGRASDLEVASNGDLYCTLGIFTRGMVVKSAATNGANTGADGFWTDITPTFTDPVHRTEIAVSPSNPQRLYCMGQDSATSQVIEIFRSDNGGASWASFAAPSGLNNGVNSQNWYNLILAVDPSNPDVVVAGGLNVARSTNAGASWATISSGVHVDNHVLMYQSSSRLIVGNDGGLWVSNNANATTPTFSNKNNNYNVTQLYGADFHPTLPDYFLAGAQDNNTHKLEVPGVNPGNPVVGGDGGNPHIDQTNGNLQIAAYVYNNFYRSTNGGASFTSLSSTNNNNGQFINVSDLDDVSKTLYAGDAAGKYYVLNNLAGTPTRQINTLAAMGTREVTAVRVDPSTPNTVWLGCSYGTSKPQLLKITNANTASPTVAVNSTITASLNNASISSVDVDPGNPNHLVVTLSNFGITSIFETTNAGTTWTAVEGNLPDMPVYWALILPATAAPIDGVSGGTGGGVLIGTDLGIFYTTATAGATTTWLPYANFPNVPVFQLKYRASDGLVLAATHGRGLWTANLPQLSSGVSNISATRNFIRYVSSMNDRLTIVPGSLNMRRMNVEMFDNQGALVYRETRNYQAVQIPVGRFAHGTYLVRITGEKGEIFVQQVVR
jgi:photosystem II stability/assembly factor-like uncharacterized protein